MTRFTTCFTNRFTTRPSTPCGLRFAMPGPAGGEPARPAAGRLLALALAFALTGGCAAQGPALPSNLPIADAPFAPAATSFVWVGTGRASVNVDGQWRRAPSQDYEFSVTQRRYDGHWESIKTQHRRHPAYDGSAGPRDQAHYFRADFADTAPGAARDFRLSTSFGDGEGKIDPAFTDGRMTFAARGISRFAPFDRYRIAQSYRYREGRLLETVELLRRGDATADPVFMRFEEEATLFAPGAVATGAVGPGSSGPAPKP